MSSLDAFQGLEGPTKVDGSEEAVHPLDAASLAVFAEKGTEGGPNVPQVGNANAVKVRRILQITRDLAARPLEELRIMDAACGEGVYSVEAALRGAEVFAFDARTERMSYGVRCAELSGLANLHFRQEDIRRVGVDSHGEFDVIFLLGILYHLDVPAVFNVIESLHDMCQQFMIVDTHISHTGRDTVEHRGHVYQGRRGREHAESDPRQVREARLLASIDNTFNFQFTHGSLIKLLNDVGFTSVFECFVPSEPLKPSNRITLVAHRGRQVKLSTYPWLNDMGETEVEAFLQLSEREIKQRAKASGATVKRVKRRPKIVVKRGLKAIFKKIGWEIRRTN